MESRPLNSSSFGPQPSNFDVMTIYRADDPCINSIGLDRLRDIYRTKHQIAWALKSRRILEIGVRAGYSAAAFVHGRTDVWYTGLDKDEGTHGGVAGYLDGTRFMLSAAYPGAWFDLQRGDSADPLVQRRLRQYFARTFDLIHIDGDHTEQGCFNDLYLAKDLVGHNGWILTDDFTNIDAVAAAVRRFSACFQDRIASEFAVDSPHGDYLMQIRRDVG